MVDEENKTTGAEAGSETDDKPVEPLPEPSLAEDYLRLEQINILRAVIVRMQGGRHPDKAIEALLRRRLNFSPGEFQGPYAIRLVCTVMMIFAASILIWAIIWAIGSALGLSYFLMLISTGLATLLAALVGVAVFHPASIPEEKALLEAIELRMGELRRELGENGSVASDSPVDADADSSVNKAASADNSEPDNNLADGSLNEAQSQAVADVKTGAGEAGEAAPSVESSSDTNKAPIEEATTG